MKKGESMKKILAIVGLVFVFAMGGFFTNKYFFGKKEVKQDKTANWKTHKSAQGIEFRYPESWKLADVQENDTIYFFNEDSIKNGVVIDEKELLRGVNNSDMYIHVEQNPKGLTADEFFAGRDVAFDEK